MNILLPPSEGKNHSLHNRTINWSSLAFANELTAARIALLETHPEIDYSRCDYASNIYNGVLYRALDYGTLTTSALIRVDSSRKYGFWRFGLIDIFKRLCLRPPA